MKLVNLIPLKELDFRNQDAFDAYSKKHKMRLDTKVKIAGKVTTAGQASKNSKSVSGVSIFGKDTGGNIFDKETVKNVEKKLKNFAENESKIAGNIDKINEYNKKLQSNWVKNSINKNENYPVLMWEYQVEISKKALNEIDEMLKSVPPPPIKAKALYRGMAVKPEDLKTFLSNFSEGKDIKLPISSFSLDPNTATDFATNINNGNTLLGESHNQSVLIKVINKNNSFNGFSMNSNVGKFDPYEVHHEWDIEEYEYQQEILMPSNNNYKVIKVETKQMKGARSFTNITLEQIGIKNEMKLIQFIDDTETDILKKHLQYPNRVSLLYKKGE